MFLFLKVSWSYSIKLLYHLTELHTVQYRRKDLQIDYNIAVSV